MVNSDDEVGSKEVMPPLVYCLGDSIHLLNIHKGSKHFIRYFATVKKQKGDSAELELLPHHNHKHLSLVQIEG